MQDSRIHHQKKENLPGTPMGSTDACHGSVTVFLCILLSVLVPLCCILTDLARLRLAQAKATGALQLTAESLLAAYDRPLREQFGVLAMAPSDKTTLEAAAFELMRANLEVEPDMGWADPFGLEVLDVEVETALSMETPEVVTTHISEYMRYRAPVTMTTGFIEKIRAFSGTVRQTQCIEEEMELERLRASMREDLVRFQLLQTTRLDLLGAGAGTGSLREEVERILLDQQQKIHAACDAYEAHAIALTTLLPPYREKRNRLAAAEETVAGTARESQEARTGMEAAEQEWLDASEGEEGVADLHETYQTTWVDFLGKQAAADQAAREAERLQSEWTAWESAQWTPIVQAAAQALDDAAEAAAYILEARKNLAAHFSKHLRYLEKALFLANGLVGQLAEIDRQMKTAMNLVQSEGTAASTGILSAAVDKAPPFPDALTMVDIRTSLQARSAKVAAWENHALEQSREATDLLAKVERTLSAFSGMQASSSAVWSVPALPGELRWEPMPGTRMDALVGFGSPADMLQSGGMKLPVYSIGQPPSERERATYAEWFAGWSGETVDDSGLSDDVEEGDTAATAKTMRSLREAAGKTAERVRNGEMEPGGTTLSEQEMASLPSHMFAQVSNANEIQTHPYQDDGTESVRIHENRRNTLTGGIHRVAGTASQIGQVAAQAMEDLLRTLWSDAYILAAFTNATTPGEGIPDSIAWGRDMSGNVFKKGEVEYILFGSGTESTNLALMKGALFSVRLALNLVHVHASPQKRASTLALATTLAGWTMFGIPVVQNFLMLAWAAAESFVDTDRLLKGQAVPMVKTEMNWFLHVGNLRGELVQNLLVDPLKGRVAGAAGQGIQQADAAVRETVGGWLDAAVESVFAPLEAQCADFGFSMAQTVESATEELPGVLSGEIAAWVAGLPQTGLQEEAGGEFQTALASWISSFRAVCVQTVAGMGVNGVARLREQVRLELRNQVFSSSFYTSLLSYAQSTTMGLLDEVFAAVEDGADRVMGPEGGVDGLKSGIVSRMATMDYAEYLAVFLLLMPGERKALRVADLMELNMKRLLEDDTYRMREKFTQVHLHANLQIKFWFIPETWLQKKDFSKISLDCTMGY